VARKYGDKAQKKVERAMHERKTGTLRSGRSGKKVTSRKQAIAIGLSEAGKRARRSRRSGAEARKSSLGRLPMASRLLQEACKVPWKLEPLPPKAPALEGPAPKGAAVPCPRHGGRSAASAPVIKSD